MAGSSLVSNPSFKIDIGEAKYPYPSHNFAVNIVTVKLSGKDVYNVWEQQMICLLTSHNMLGFIKDTFPSPSDGKGKAKDEDVKAWVRSNSLVKGWILGSLSEKVAVRVVNRLKQKNAGFSAKDAWDELKSIYGPRTEEVNSTPEDAISVNEGKIHRVSRSNILYWQILRGKTEDIIKKFGEQGLRPWDRIADNGDTSLHVAVSTHNQELLKILLQLITEDNSKQLNVPNSYGSTPLHVAAIVGNIEAAHELVKRYPELLYVKDKKGRTPLDISLYNMHLEISLRLLEHAKNYEDDLTKILGTGDEDLIRAIFHKNFDWALDLANRHEMILHGEAVLMAIAQNFPRELSFWERRDEGFLIFIIYLYNYQYRHLYNNFCICVIDIDYHAWEDKNCRLIWKFLIFGISKIYMVSVTIIRKIVSPFLKKRWQTYNVAKDLLSAVFAKIEKNIDSGSGSLSLPQYYTNLLFGATRLNAFEVVNLIVLQHQDEIWSINEEGLNFIQYAVINRSEKIYNLLYTPNMSKHKNIYKTIKDADGNNLLHLAGRLAPADKLNLISGAALQLQREFQWFKEVEEFVGPITRVQTNYDDETPQMVFTREHVDLVIEGEKWMRSTAESYTITAALIITIVFAAAITVPGGNNQDTGIPIHNNNIAFKIFAVSDAISLFAAVTSLLMFLSILTTRFSAEDFHFKLPKRLIIGLAALFISTTAMIIAFGATLFLVFGHDNLWILIPIGVLTCLPITSFVTLQFPLIVDLTGATYGHIFYKRKEYSY